MQGQFIRTANSLVPGCDEAQAMMKHVPVGDPVLMSVRVGRSARQNALFHQLCKIVFDNSEKFQSPEEVKDSAKLKCGHYRVTYVRANNEDYALRCPKSLTEFDHDGFNKFGDQAIDYFVEELGVEKKILLSEVKHAA